MYVFGWVFVCIGTACIITMLIMSNIGIRNTNEDSERRRREKEKNIDPYHALQLSCGFKKCTKCEKYYSYNDDHYCAHYSYNWCQTCNNLWLDSMVGTT